MLGAWPSLRILFCLCLVVISSVSPHPWRSITRWGSTRTVKIKGYDASLMRAFFSSGNEQQLRDQMKTKKDGVLKHVSAATGVLGHACSLFSAKVVVFLAAPTMSHSLYCWYTGCALLTSLLCVGLISFYVMKKMAGGKRAIVFGIVSWAGFAWQVVVWELLLSWYSLGAFCVCALIGFLIGYNFPPTERHQFSLQVVLQFLSLAVVLNVSPSPLCEGVSIVGLVCTVYLFNQFSGDRGAKRGGRRDSVEGVVGGAESAPISRPSGGASLSSLWGAGTRKRSSKGGRMRLTQKQYLEENYKGPLKGEMLRSNPFHCTGASEYLTEEQYQSQRLSYTQQQEAALLEYMQREGMAKFSHVLSPAARLNMSDRLARTYSSSDEDLDAE